MERLRPPSHPSTPAAQPPGGDQPPLPLASRAVLLTPVQAADMLGVSHRLLERWRGSGDGPQFVRLSRKSIRYRVEDLDAFVAGSLRASTASAESHAVRG